MILKITYFVVELWQLDLHLLPLEKMVLGLLTDGWDHVELPCDRVGFLGTEGIATEFMPASTGPSSTYSRGGAHFSGVNVDQGDKPDTCKVMVTIFTKRGTKCGKSFFFGRVETE